MVQIGQKVRLGWNGAKYFTEYPVHAEVRVEAIGVDWVVVRCAEGRAYATGVEIGVDILWELES